MTWNEIQSKWAAMARRIRSDLPQDSDGTDIIRAFQTPSQPSQTELRAPLPQARNDAFPE